ncbi:biopolymer transporter ExbD [uncultured Desulfobacter sp.]|uniref:ExbD/TolR family protein n=1 Tax=uncultured Desulfobacter sp. TaxID=240139 RepID=UPI0029F59692|nr:biopolymer transporter ExbD [uncultured Desulfobacter sp.]
MRRNLYSQESFDEINVTPLLDLAWTLLVVFIIAVTASVQGIKVNLPKASDVPSLAKPKTKAITIDDKGQLYLDAYPVTMAELETNLRAHKAVDPNFPVVIKGDAKIYYQNVMDVLDLMQKLEISQLGLVTQKLVK